MRSVVVVLPASMCAQIPMFRVRSNGTSLSADAFAFCPACFGCSNTACIFYLRMLTVLPNFTTTQPWLVQAGEFTSGLPAVVRKRTVGLRHLVRIFALLHGRARIIGRIQNL